LNQIWPERAIKELVTIQGGKELQVLS